MNKECESESESSFFFFFFFQIDIVNLASGVALCGSHDVNIHALANWLIIMSHIALSSVQFRVVSMRSEKSICVLYAPLRLSDALPTSSLKQFHPVRLMDDGPLSSFQRRSSSASAFHASFLQTTYGLMSLQWLSPRR